jgi:cyanuric acid amidohydrolase
MIRQARVHRISAAAPDDSSGIEAAIQTGRLDPAGIVGIFGKTEGNGCVNDFSRGYATQSLGLMLRRHLPAEQAAAVCLVMSGGTEGGMAPHWVVFEQIGGHGGSSPSLAIGRSHTADLPVENLGRLAQIDLVVDGVRAAMRDGAIEDPADVHLVQVKCPLLTAQRVREAEGRGVTLATRDTLKSMGLSRSASALGIGVALGEIERSQLDNVMIGSAADLWSSRASCSAGIELLNHEIVVLGMSRAWCGPLAIDHAVMKDGIDIEPVRSALARLGLTANGQLPERERAHLVAMLAKAEASRTGLLRGHRHTMLDDSDISSTRHARAFVVGVLAALVGHTEIFVSGGAEHQGPDGGGPVALIVDRTGAA